MEDGPVSLPSKWAPGVNVFTAIYEAKCKGCPELIIPGQKIRQWNYGPKLLPKETTYTHKDCVITDS